MQQYFESFFVSSLLQKDSEIIILLHKILIILYLII